jgi:exonuclease SbcC
LEDQLAAQDRAREQHNLRTTQLDNARESQTRLQSEHKALQLLRQLVAERAQLQSGEPCPLCGGLDHPYVEGGRLEAAETHALVRSGELELELADLAQQTETLQTSLQTLALEEAAQGQLRLQQTQDVARLAQELKAAMTAWHDSLSQAGLPAAVDAAAVREVQTSVSGLQLACARTEQVLDAAEADQRKAMLTVQAAESNLASLDSQLAGYTATVEQQRQTLVRLQEELDAAQVAVQAQLQTLSGQLHAVGIDGPESLQGDADWRQLAVALELVSQRAAAFVAADQTHKQAAAEALDSTAAAQRAQDAVVAAQTAQQTAALALAKQQAELEQVTAELQQVLQGRDPEVVDRELTAALQTAEHHAKVATDALQTAERRLLTATTRLQETRRLLSQTTEQLAKQEDLLANAIAELGLPDVTALRHRLLPEPQVQVLRHKRQTLQQATAVATGHRNGRQEDVRHHAERRPASLLQDATAQGLQVAIQDLTATLNDHRDALAAIRAQLNQNASNHAERDRLQQDVTAKQQVNAVWQRLHKLIGVNSGQSFQRFAQILNLEELAGKANHHLQLLAPRYKLVVARNSDLEPRLDFAVEDEYQAEERRPLTTLSGGETFLVSLSLALALADYRAVQMPIETLLLDEGFGTLDPQTLASAMTALKALSQSSGVQVGLISHVESLKQEIAARVVVERQGNGRSVVRMEVGL